MQSLMMRVIKHSKSTQSNKFAISLQQHQKNVRSKVHPLHADEHQRFHKLVLLFLMAAAIYVRSTQDEKSINCFAIYWERSIVTAFMTYCDWKHSDILQGSSHFRCYLFLDGSVQKRAHPFKSWKYKICCIYSTLKVLKVTSLQYLYNNIEKV